MEMVDDFTALLAEKKGASSRASAALRNDDFRKLLTSTRSSASATSAFGSGDSSSKPAAAHSFTHRATHNPEKRGGGGGGGGKHKRRPHHAAHGGGAKGGENGAAGGGAAKEEEDEFEDSLNDILKNYRDRAAERRKGENKSDMGGSEMAQLAGAYRAVPGDRRAAADAKERRRQAIQESKYLGGDMEHTHLVKGLDYSLLHKVRNEIEAKESVGDDQLEAQYQQKESSGIGEGGDKLAAAISASTNPMVKNILRTLFKDEQPRRNELFGARRMAYVVEFDDETGGDSDIPTTLMRSKHDCPIEETNADSSTNTLVIQKLTQVLAYLRADVKKKKKEKLEATKETVGGDEKPESKHAGQTGKVPGDCIYDDIGEYVPEIRRPASPTSAATGQSSRQRPDSYFERPEPGQRGVAEQRGDGQAHRASAGDARRGGGGVRGEEPPVRARSGANVERERERAAPEHRDRERFSHHRRGGDGDRRGDRSDARLGSDADHPVTVDPKASRAPSSNAGGGKQQMPTATARARGDINMSATDDSYAECYPGGAEMYSAANESDDEADYSKMDMGNRKGPVKRWDFENSDDYEKYMGAKEALPKAAYQYGVKANDGRKTRKSAAGGPGGAGGDREKSKLDRQMNEINKLLEKKRKAGEGGGQTSSDGKKMKY